MQVNHSQLYDDICNAFLEAVKKAQSDDSYSLSDMYVGVNMDESQLLIYDDTMNPILQLPIDECDELKEDMDNFYPSLEVILRDVLHNEKLKSVFESIDLMAPFSVILIDEDQNQIAELITVDHDLVVIDDELLQKIDRELDEFYENLMSDIK